MSKAGIPFQVYERDESATVRGQGWAITIHWALPFLKELLSGEAFAGLEGVQVDPEVGRNDTGNFIFLNLETLEAKFKIPPAERRRLDRNKLRKHLLGEVSEQVHWHKKLVGVEPAEDGVVALFDDGSRAEGEILVGAEGINSQTRQYLAPETYKNARLPIRFTGTAVNFTPEAVKPLRAIDPLLFLGCHPTSGNFIWVSTLETPEANGTQGTANEYYRVQINMSWPFESAVDEVKSTSEERLAEMKRRAEEFHPTLRNTINSIPDSAEIIEIVLQDWPCLKWDSHGGRVTLVGDAAHAMTMYRGEAANHGFLDALNLCQALQEVYDGTRSVQKAVEDYEKEMRDRTGPAVLLSRQACLDAHDWDSLNENSAILRRRVIR